MEACLNIDQLFAEGPLRLRKLKEVGDSFPDADDPKACASFSQQVDAVESYVKWAYRTATRMARVSQKPESEVAILGHLSGFCVDAINIISSLTEKYPFCGTPSLYDLVLDYRNAAEARRRNLLAEQECQDLPPELFQTQN